MDADAEVQAWHSWREACAFGLIDAEERDRLHQVVGERFRSRVKRLNAHGAGLPPLENRECAHLFESWCALHQRRDGKRYKDWLLNRGRRDLDTLQSGVMLLVRNVVREWVREFHSPKAELSLDQPLNGVSGLTLRELLPEERAAERSAEESRWMRDRVRVLIEKASAVERAVLRIRAERRVFSHPQVKEDTGFGKTALHNHHRALLERLAGEVGEHFPGLGAEEASGMVLQLLDQAGNKILKKNSAENGSPGVFG